MCQIVICMWYHVLLTATALQFTGHSCFPVLHRLKVVTVTILYSRLDTISQRHCES